MFLHVCMLICAIIISSVSAFYSIIGLTTLYASQYWAVVIMASALELGKVTTATWCHQHHYSISWWIKSYLGFAIVVLMALTSMGIFGFLTRAHIDQQLKLELASGGDSADIDIQIEIKKNALDDLDKQIKQLDDTIALQKANRAMNELTNQRNTRNKLNNQRGTVATELGTLKSSKLKADAEVRKVEAEVGPVRYLADWWYGGNSTKEQKERAVTWVTIMIVHGGFIGPAPAATEAGKDCRGCQKEGRGSQDAAASAQGTRARETDAYGHLQEAYWPSQGQQEQNEGDETETRARAAEARARTRAARGSHSNP
jgi:hypothetical protein